MSIFKVSLSNFKVFFHLITWFERVKNVLWCSNHECKTKTCKWIDDKYSIISLNYNIDLRTKLAYIIFFSKVVSHSIKHFGTAILQHADVNDKISIYQAMWKINVYQALTLKVYYGDNISF